tara:strand:- start:651 stop:1919 length:1269 start_codon:yes stop_codon:yes gene_type:complete
MALTAFTNVALQQFVEIHSEVFPNSGINKEEMFEKMMGKIHGDLEREIMISDGETSPVERAEVEPSVEIPSSSLTFARFQCKVSAEGLSKLKGGLVYEKDGEKFKIDIPYAPGIDYSATCCGVQQVNGMLRPCATRPQKGKDCCKTCEKSNHKFGKATDLMKEMKGGQWKAPNGKEGISFGTYCMKRCLDREFVEEQIKIWNQGNGENLVIPEDQWISDTTKGKRAVKSVSVSSDSGSVDGSEEAPKKRRGRPPKNPEAKKETKDPNAPKKKRGRPKKNNIAENVATSSEPSQDEKPDDFLIAIMGGSTNKKADTKPEKKVTPQVEKEENVVKEESDDEDAEIVIEEEDEDEELEEEVAMEFEPIEYQIDGKWYGYDNENTLFHINGPIGHNPLKDEIDEDYLEVAGVWDPETNKPVFKSED